MIVWLLIVAGVAIAAVSVLVYRNRKPNSLEAGLRDFRRGLDALDPANDPLRRNRVDGQNVNDDPAGRRDPRSNKRR